jgi:O-antigen polysaccharide polymerase Wzy
VRPPSVLTQPLVLGVYAAATAVLAIGLALFASPGSGDVLLHFAWVAALSIAVTGSLIAIAGVWTTTGVYAAIFWCFHFGLVAMLASRIVTTQDLANGDDHWVLAEFSSIAAVQALIGCVAFASGAAAIYGWRGVAQRAPETAAARGQGGHPHGATGSILLFGALAVWCGVILASGGLAGFSVSYEEFREMTTEYAPVLAITSPAIGCGIVLSVTGRSGWLRTAAVIAFVLYALVALPIGLRTDVMFPAVVALIASARCGRPFSTAKAALLALLLLVLIPIVRDLRTTGIGAVAEAVVSPPRFDALVEMGESLRPVEQVVRWHAEGEPYQGGSSYWAPFERAAARLLPGFEVAAAETDLRLMNVLVLDRIGAIGFSPVAEAYRNFGPIGVALALGLLGMGLAAIDTIRDRQVAVLAIATLYPPLLINVRNSFVSVPAQCVAGVLLVAVVAIARHVVGSVASRTAHASAAHV